MKALFLLTGSNEVRKYRDSFANLELGEVVDFRYDDPNCGEQTLYGKIKECAPDIIFYVGSRWGATISIATLCRINSTIAPMVHICSDAADFPWHDLLREYTEKGAFTLQVAIDGSKKWPGSSHGLTLLTPVDPITFPDIPQPHSARGIICGFAGNAGGGDGSRRTQILSGLLEARVVDLRIRSNLPFTYESYCDYLSRCRMSVNIAYSGSEATLQVKGRVIESALACALLFETKGAPTSEWLTPEEDYLEYGNVPELIEMIHHFSNKPEQTETIAVSLRNKVMAEHGPHRFWQAILNKVGMRMTA